MIQKVTAFIIRKKGKSPQLLLFEHPHAGIQIPAGTVEEGETPQEAILRELREETGLEQVSIINLLGNQKKNLPEDQKYIKKHTKVYSRPNLSGFDWATLRPGITVHLIRTAPGFSQIEFREYDQVPDARFETMVIKGWVPNETLADSSMRTFFLVGVEDIEKESWTHFADNHTFTFFWSWLDKLPQIIQPQDTWLQFLEKEYPQVSQRRQ